MSPLLKLSKKSHTIESQERVDVELQISPLKGSLRQKSGSKTEPVQGSDTRSKPVSLLNSCQKTQSEIQETDDDSRDNSIGDDNNPTLTKTGPRIE